MSAKDYYQGGQQQQFYPPQGLFPYLCSLQLLQVTYQTQEDHSRADTTLSSPNSHISRNMGKVTSPSLLPKQFMCQSKSSSFCRRHHSFDIVRLC